MKDIAIISLESGFQKYNTELLGCSCHYIRMWLGPFDYFLVRLLPGYEDKLEWVANFSIEHKRLYYWEYYDG